MFLHLGISAADFALHAVGTLLASTAIVVAVKQVAGRRSRFIIGS